MVEHAARVDEEVEQGGGGAVCLVDGLEGVYVVLFANNRVPPTAASYQLTLLPTQTADNS